MFKEIIYFYDLAIKADKERWTLAQAYIEFYKKYQELKIKGLLDTTGGCNFKEDITFSLYNNGSFLSPSNIRCKISHEL